MFIFLFDIYSKNATERCGNILIAMEQGDSSAFFPDFGCRCSLSSNSSVLVSMLMILYSSKQVMAIICWHPEMTVRERTGTRSTKHLWI